MDAEGCCSSNSSDDTETAVTYWPLTPELSSSTPKTGRGEVKDAARPLGPGTGSASTGCGREGVAGAVLEARYLT